MNSKKDKIGHIEIHPQFVVRSPVYSISRILKLFSEDKPWAFVETIVHDSYFMKALLLASPSFHSTVLREIKKEKKEPISKKLLNTLLKYYIRMCSRATPFGCFSGVGVATFSKGNNSYLTKRDNHKLHTFIDYNLISFIKEYLQTDSFPASIVLYPSTSSFIQGGYINYSLNNSGSNDNLFIEKQTKLNSILIEILDKVKNGCRFSEVCELIVSNGYDMENAKEYLIQLIHEQILTTDLDISTVTQNLEGLLLDKIQTHFESENHSAINVLSTFIEHKNHFDYSKYQEFIALVQKEFSQYNADKYNNVLLEQEYSGLLPFKTRYQIKRAFHVLQYFGNPSNNNIDKFTTKFENIFGQKEVPLLHALNNTTGIGYPDLIQYEDSYTSNLNPDPVRKKPIYTLNSTQLHLHRKLLDDWDGSHILTLNDEDLKAMNEPTKNNPITTSCIAEIVRDGDKSFLYAKGLSGSTANSNIARFNFIPSVYRITREVAEFETNSSKDYLLAELSFISNSTMVNVNRHLNNFQFSINYFNGNNIGTHNIDLNDLILKVENGILKIVSKSKNRYIRPIISTAYNPLVEHNPIYRFFHDYQSINSKDDLYFDWGGVERLYKYLPRIIYKDIILAPAQWNLKPHLIGLPEWIGPSGKINWILIKQKISEYNIPRYIKIREWDRQLLIDLESPLGIELFVDVLQNKHFFCLIEPFVTDDSMVKSPSGDPISSEFVFILKNKNNEI